MKEGGINACNKRYLWRIEAAQRSIKKKKRHSSKPLATQMPLQKDGGYLLSHCYAVPSARLGLTSLFGMGRGGSPIL